MSDLCRKWLAVAVVCSQLGACSVALMPARSNQPRSAGPVLVDTAIALAAAGLAVAASSSCHDGLDCAVTNTIITAPLAIIAVPFGLSALYGYGRLNEVEKPAPPAPLAQQQITPPGMTLTCQQRRDAQLALAKQAAEEQGQAITVRDLPDCD